MSHTFFVIINFQFFKEILSDTSQCIGVKLSETTGNIVMLFPFSEILFYCLHQIMTRIYVNEAKNVNKDSPVLTVYASPGTPSQSTGSS